MFEQTSFNNFLEENSKIFILANKNELSQTFFENSTTQKVSRVQFDTCRIKIILISIKIKIQYTQYTIFSTIFRCDFIQMGYYIHTVARTAGVYDDIVVKLPIVIDPKVISIH